MGARTHRHLHLLVRGEVAHGAARSNNFRGGALIFRFATRRDVRGLSWGGRSAPRRVFRGGIARAVHDRTRGNTLGRVSARRALERCARRGRRPGGVPARNSPKSARMLTPFFICSARLAARAVLARPRGAPRIDLRVLIGRSACRADFRATWDAHFLSFPTPRSVAPRPSRVPRASPRVPRASFAQPPRCARRHAPARSRRASRAALARVSRPAPRSSPLLVVDPRVVARVSRWRRRTRRVTRSSASRTTRTSPRSSARTTTWRCTATPTAATTTVPERGVRLSERPDGEQSTPRRCSATTTGGSVQQVDDAEGGAGETRAVFVDEFTCTRSARLGGRRAVMDDHGRSRVFAQCPTPRTTSSAPASCVDSTHWVQRQLPYLEHVTRFVDKSPSGSCRAARGGNPSPTPSTPPSRTRNSRADQRRRHRGGEADARVQARGYGGGGRARRNKQRGAAGGVEGVAVERRRAAGGGRGTRRGKIAGVGQRRGRAGTRRGGGGWTGRPCRSSALVPVSRGARADAQARRGGEQVKERGRRRAEGERSVIRFHLV